MNKHPYTHSFVVTSFRKAIVMPFSSVISFGSPSLALSRPISIASAAPERARTSSSPFFILALTFVVLLVSTVPLHQGIEAAPGKMPKHTAAPDNLINAMAVTFDEKSPLPLQLQLEAQVQDTQKLTYLPTRAIPGSASAPPMTFTITPQNTMTLKQGVYPNNNLDFYYINYRPTYIAGESQIDFWMLSAQGSGQAPKTASLELMDEYGKVRLAVLVPEGTEVPQDLAAKFEPFLWKTWTVPKTLASEFEFSDKFRVVLKTSSTMATVKNVADKNTHENNSRSQKKKRFVADASTVEDFSGVQDEVESSFAQAPVVKVAVAAAPAAPAGPVAPGTHNVVLVQDRQFRIKGLQAIPGGKPNPAKLLFVSHLAPPTSSDDNQGKTSTGLNNRNPSLTSAASAPLKHMEAGSWAATLLVVALATTAFLC